MKIKKYLMPLAFGVLGGLLSANLLIWVPTLRGQPDSVSSQLNLLVDLRHLLVTDYVEEPDQHKMMVAAAKAMVESLNDPYTDYFTPDEFSSFNTMVHGSFFGIGAEVDIHEKRLRIVSPIEGSPALKAGVVAGDMVLEIDGKSTEGIKIDDAIRLLKGPEGTPVTIKVRHLDGTEAVLPITRGNIQVSTVKGARRGNDQKWDFMLDKEKKIGYVRLLQFSDRSADELKAAVETLNTQGMKGLIIDLRYNPGGLLEIAQTIANMFLKPDLKIVSVEGRVYPKKVYMSGPGGLFLNGPIVVLVNEYSASASEILSGALLENHRAELVGTRTFGKGSVQNINILGLNDPNTNADNGGEGAIKITEAYYYLPSGRNIHKRPDKNTWGVDPNDGFYVSMKPEQMIRMNEIRRAGDVLHDKYPDTQPNEPSPEWIAKEFADPQLAAGLKAVAGYLQTGEYPHVGQSGAQAIAMTTKRDELVRSRTQVAKALADIDSQIAKIDSGVLSDKPDHPGIDKYEPNRPAVNKTTPKESNTNDPATQPADPQP